MLCKTFALGRVRACWRLLAVFSVFGFVVFAGSVVAGASPKDARPSVSNLSGCGWNLVSSPNVETYNSLSSVEALSSSDVWIVGSAGPGAPGQLSLIEHWDGQLWGIVPSPNPGSAANNLLDVAAVSANDIWAVGYSGPNITSGSQTLAMHWNGTTWSHVPSPNPGTLDNSLNGLAVISANDIWAVGSMWGSNGHRMLALHWNGSDWSNISVPNVGAFEDYIMSVTALSSNDVWAVGYAGFSSIYQTLVMHWDGSQWRAVPSPNIESTNNYLNAVSAASASDVWAVGYSCLGNCFGANIRRTLAMHWNGSAWSMVPHPDLGTDETILYGVVALLADDAWAVGSYMNGTQSNTLTTHWDGSVWSAVPSINPQSCCPQFNDIDALSSGEMWAVGAYHFPGNPVFRTLTERYSAACGTVTPSPTPPSVTNTPTTLPTRTPTFALTSTPVPTYTPCVFDFSDVSPSDYFYLAVQYMACHGAISGYADGSFRPYSNTTRGQLCKIIVLAEGWMLECPQTGHFSDLPASNPFYCFVETTYSHRAISGYADGTFRSDNNVTRGQFCKIIVNAEGWRLTCTSVGHFTDVPNSDPFYCYIETAYAHDVISGYSDGTFRQGNAATRGQVCKIVYQAVNSPRQ